MKMVHRIVKVLSSRQLIVDFLDDLRSVSANVILVGGIGSFFGMTNPHYVIISGMLLWIISSVTSSVLKDN